MKRILILLFAGLALAGCVQTECVNGERWRKEKFGADVWERMPDTPPCMCDGTNGKPIPCGKSK